MVTEVSRTRQGCPYDVGQANTMNYVQHISATLTDVLRDFPHL